MQRIPNCLPKPTKHEEPDEDKWTAYPTLWKFDMPAHDRDRHDGRYDQGSRTCCNCGGEPHRQHDPENERNRNAQHRCAGQGGPSSLGYWIHCSVRNVKITQIPKPSFSPRISRSRGLQDQKTILIGVPVPWNLPRNGSSWTERTSPRSPHLQYDALQIVRFRNTPQDRMVRCLCTVVHFANPFASVLGSLRKHLAKAIRGHVL